MWRTFLEGLNKRQSCFYICLRVGRKGKTSFPLYHPAILRYYILRISHCPWWWCPVSPAERWQPHLPDSVGVAEKMSQTRDDFWELFIVEAASCLVGARAPKRCGIVIQGVLIRVSVNICETFQGTSQIPWGENSEAAEVPHEQREESLWKLELCLLSASQVFWSYLNCPF